MSDKIPVTIRWQGGGVDVKLAGQFNSWTPEPTDKVGHEEWTKTLNLAPGNICSSFLTVS